MKETKLREKERNNSFLSTNPSTLSAKSSQQVIHSDQPLLNIYAIPVRKAPAGILHLLTFSPPLWHGAHRHREKSRSYSDVFWHLLSMQSVRQPVVSPSFAQHVQIIGGDTGQRNAATFQYNGNGFHQVYITVFTKVSDSKYLLLNFFLRKALVFKLPCNCTTAIKWRKADC